MAFSLPLSLPHRPLSLADLVAELYAPSAPAFAEPCLCDLCQGAPKLRGVPCGQCGEPLWGCSAVGCSNEGCWRMAPAKKVCWCLFCKGSLVTDGLICHDCGNARSSCPNSLCICVELERIRARHRPSYAATRIQSLWRGHKSRKDLIKKNAEELAVVEERWRLYDQEYRLCVLSQNLMVALKRDDDLWDATATSFYIWMLENGPWIEEAEDFMRLRGWVRPKNSRLPLSLILSFFTDALKQCGLTAEEMRIARALMDTFASAVE
jgi:hypothetical protein